jgi:hypothetical protein
MKCSGKQKFSSKKTYTETWIYAAQLLRYATVEDCTAMQEIWSHGGQSTNTETFRSASLDKIKTKFSSSQFVAC